MDKQQRIEDLYHEYSKQIYRYIFMMIADHQQAKDLMHDTFVKAFRYIESLERKTSEKNWLYQIARSVTIDHIRKMKPIQFIKKLRLKSTSNIPEKIVELGEKERQLYQAMRRLKHTYQEVIILRKIDEFTIEETAGILNWSQSKVKTTLFRALKALKEEMIKEGYTHE